MGAVEARKKVIWDFRCRGWGGPRKVLKKGDIYAKCWRRKKKWARGRGKRWVWWALEQPSEGSGNYQDERRFVTRQEWEAQRLKVLASSLENEGMQWRENTVNLKEKSQDFPGGPVVKTPHSQCRGPRFNSWSGNYVLNASTKTQHSQIKKKCFYIKI